MAPDEELYANYLHCQSVKFNAMTMRKINESLRRHSQLSENESAIFHNKEIV